MSTFIEWLENLNKRDTKVRAILKRSLANEAGEHIESFPYVERFLIYGESSWHRRMHYLVAGLWAAHWREGREGISISIPKACSALDHELRRQAPSGDIDKLTGLERRFIALLDADSDQLPHRLRQMVTLLKEQPLDFGLLLEDLLRWNHPEKRTQHRWARDFYRAQESDTTPSDTTPIEEPQS